MDPHGESRGTRTEERPEPVPGALRFPQPPQAPRAPEAPQPAAEPASADPPPPPAVRAPRTRREWPGWTRSAVVAGVLVVVVGLGLTMIAGAVERLNPFRNGLIEQRTTDRSGPAVVKAISDMGEFRAASGYYELVVDIEKEIDPLPSFLAGERVLFVAAGTVEAGVNLRNLPPDAVTVNTDRTAATITLPRPTLSQPRIDVERSYVYSHQRGLIDRLKGAATDNPTADERQLYTLASQRLTEAAKGTQELTTRGEANTRAMLEGLLRSLGFTDVTITFTG